MKLHVIDETALARPDPGHIRLYLAQNGWRRLPRERDAPDIWAMEGSSGYIEVIAPTSREYRDYRRRVADVLRALSSAEDRSELDVLFDLTRVGYDVQYIRHRIADTSESEPSGTIALDDAAVLYKASHALLDAAAASLPPADDRTERQLHTLRKGLMRRILAGPTSAGSFVMSVWVPLGAPPPALRQRGREPNPPPDTDQATLFDAIVEAGGPADGVPEILDDATAADDESQVPFGRATTLRLSDAVEGARSAIDEVKEAPLSGATATAAFGRRAHEGVTAQLCESLANLGGIHGSAFEVSLAWSMQHPTDRPRRPVRFDARAIEILHRAAADLRRPPDQPARLQGRVVRLVRQGSSGGEVSVLVDASDAPGLTNRRVFFHVDESTYQRALEADASRAQVEIAGILKRDGNRTEVTRHQGIALS